jgi:hypothetical protein
VKVLQNNRSPDASLSSREIARGGGPPTAKVAAGPSPKENNLLELPDDELRQVLIAGPSDEAPVGCRVGDPVWIYAKSSFPSYSRSQRSINFNGHFRLTDHPSLEMAVKRYVIAMKYFPVRRHLDLPSLRKRADWLAGAAEWIVDVGFGSGINCFRDVPPERMPDLIQHISAKWTSQNSLRTLGNYFHELAWQGARGLLRDFFLHLKVDENGRLELSPPSATLPEDPSEQHDAPEQPETRQEDDYGTYLPYPDEWLEQAGWRWSYYLRNVQPTLAILAVGFRERSAPENYKNRQRAWGGSSAVAPLSDSTASNLMPGENILLQQNGWMPTVIGSRDCHSKSEASRSRPKVTKTSGGYWQFAKHLLSSCCCCCLRVARRKS